jgi:hypothetical protein
MHGESAASASASLTMRRYRARMAVRLRIVFGKGGQIALLLGLDQLIGDHEDHCLFGRSVRTSAWDPSAAKARPS